MGSYDRMFDHSVTNIELVKQSLLEAPKSFELWLGLSESVWLKELSFSGYHPSQKKMRLPFETRISNEVLSKVIAINPRYLTAIFKIMAEEKYHDKYLIDNTYLENFYASLEAINFILKNKGLGGLERPYWELNEYLDLQRAKKGYKQIHASYQQKIDDAYEWVKRFGDKLDSEPDHMFGLKIVRQTKYEKIPYTLKRNQLPKLFSEVYHLKYFHPTLLNNHPTNYAEDVSNYIETHMSEILLAIYKILVNKGILITGEKVEYSQTLLRLNYLSETLRVDNHKHIILNDLQNIDIKKMGLNQIALSDSRLRKRLESLSADVVNIRGITKVVLSDEPNRWKELGQIELNSMGNLIDPESTPEEFVQIKQLAGRVKYLRNINENAFPYLAEYLSERNISPKSKLTDFFDTYFLFRFQNWIEKKYVETSLLSANSVKAILFTTNCILILLKELDPDWFSEHEKLNELPATSERVNNTHKPFSLIEREKLFQAINSEIEWSKRTTAPFTYRTDKDQCPFDNSGYLQKENLNPESIRWVFEHEIVERFDRLGIDFQYLKKEWIGRHDGAVINTLGRFSNLSRKLQHHMGLDKEQFVWDYLEVLTYKNIERALVPFILKIVQLTGLNSEVVKYLTIDSLEESDPISRKPVLRYWKARSRGSKTLHLPLIDSEFTHIDNEQYYVLRECFDYITQITSLYRGEAKDEDKEFLILFPNTSPFGHSRPKQAIQRFSASIFKRMYTRFVQKYDLKDELSDEPLQVNISRFRPTLVSELLRKGKDFRTIKHILGHKSLYTTYQYLESHDFHGIAQEKLRDALTKIHVDSLSSIKVISQPKRIEDTYKTTPTPMCNCKNIMNPPEWIKKSKNYREGMACSQYNKCLSCEHAVITVKNLPDLFVQYRKLRDITSVENIQVTPYGKFVIEQLGILASILNPKTSEFSEEELQRAEQYSLFTISECSDAFGR